TVYQPKDRQQRDCDEASSHVPSAFISVENTTMLIDRHRTLQGAGTIIRPGSVMSQIGTKLTIGNVCSLVRYRGCTLSENGTSRYLRLRSTSVVFSEQGRNSLTMRIYRRGRPPFWALGRSPRWPTAE